MPHIKIEYNSAVAQVLSIDQLVTKLHSVAMSIEALPIGGIRTRASCADICRVGDGAISNGFIYITVRIGQGRTDTMKKDIGDQLFTALTDITKQYFDDEIPISLGLEIQEIEKKWTWKKNNIHQIIKDKKNGPK